LNVARKKAKITAGTLDARMRTGYKALAGSAVKTPNPDIS
jgi:hypothetical protein